MKLPERIRVIIKQEMEGKNEWPQLVRRKGDPVEQSEDRYTGIRIPRDPSNQDKEDKEKSSPFDVLPEGLAKEELLKFWMGFHAHFPYPDFARFYSKMDFCLFFTNPSYGLVQFQFDTDDFIILLADRKFLFLEDNRFGANPAYPHLSEIVRNSEKYVKDEHGPENPAAMQPAEAEMRERAGIIREQGFVPTRAHKQAYDELRTNESVIRAALAERKALLQRSQHFFCDGEIQFRTFTIPISDTKKTAEPIDKELGQLFHDFLYVATYRAYVKKYSDLIDNAEKNSLNAIICVRQYLEENLDIPFSKALIFWWLFTKETTKLARGKLKKLTFKMPEVKTGRRLTRHTQATTYRKIDCQIMLFDYLLKLLPPAGENEEQEIACAKFQFHAFSKYNRYTHFKVKDLEGKSKSNCKFNFNLNPDPNDYVDHLGGVIRKNILRCIPNDVRWLTPGLPNNWNTNSGIFATLLLQDISRYPKTHRLINRINAFLKDSEIDFVQTYRDCKDNQSELIALLEGWCRNNDLLFEDDIPSSDIKMPDEWMKRLCSRWVLEYVLKEQVLIEVRKGLSAVANELWGDLLLTGYETFYLDDDD